MPPCFDKPWNLAGMEISLAAAPPQPDWLWSRVVAPTSDIAVHVQSSGLQITDVEDADRDLFTKGAEAISRVPNLAAIVATRVAAVHLLRADPGYDVSHSEPQWRDRIFVSVPDRRDDVGGLRLAEEIIHEALHLHLTQFEAVNPIIRDLTGTLMSPWRGEPRSYQGVLHGAFVFAGLKAYFDIIAVPSGDPSSCHVDQRRAQIATELAEVDQLALRVGLTAAGAALLSRVYGKVAEVGDP